MVAQMPSGKKTDFRFPDGSVIRNIPAGRSIDDVLNELESDGYDVSEKRALLASSPSAANNIGAFDAFTQGAGQGFQQLGQGIKQAGLEAGEFVGLADQGAAQAYTQQVDQQRQQFAQSPAGPISPTIDPA